MGVPGTAVTSTGVVQDVTVLSYSSTMYYGSTNDDGSRMIEIRGAVNDETDTREYRIWYVWVDDSTVVHPPTISS